MDKASKAILVLEDGRTFVGTSFGADGERFGEMVFNTSMSGYQEILTDPSYAGQIICMTYPLIGNYGTNTEDVESRRPWAEGFVVREASRIASNFRSTMSLQDYLKANDIVAIEHIDTRALVRHIRDKGAMRAGISTIDADRESLLAKVLASPEMTDRELATSVTTGTAYEYSADGSERFHVVAYDFGIKTNSLREFAKFGCRVTVVPAATSADEVLALKPDGIFLSNGPGDPASMQTVVNEVKKLVASQIPMFGICLGHQLIGSAFGGTTYKLKYGHRGGNQPVKDLTTGKIEITAHNHGFAVDAASLPADVEVTHVNLNDQTVAGLRHTTLPVFSVQYHPESAPGPHDSEYLFERFIGMMA
ncbi:MAG TPA: glutamine-hydrolyzing carbamoyl-phosphate synthase small subunit [Pyrinomonadaceae bacterium]|nr:glutamine-hydrolyzing carbamoyl-phosphate synthase small subunit [Chloracidobacterium sp.]MBP9107923.1 glutamine-hydrolyzing carbamoyl-phosphate synthase small subunit [Pyrinomonadaceae bacterium]MBL0242072.1 glutamine-hydrolyzing carbamoyl-phosphate synthase small subunit [Chloracidobacterium sp.]HQX55589.1 glutamine-hydrolyzing carbamoyl-phosphate synthase small subunit [Pyrinomonadaceae bacterium]HQY67909.1 glutamine-hydrolyzing carbamoyl-phosphate synthase small subunit [Pyrinomonadaceae